MPTGTHWTLKSPRAVMFSSLYLSHDISIEISLIPPVIVRRGLQKYVF